MQSRLLSIILLLFHDTQTTALKTQSTPDVVINFNSTGINYSKEVLFFLFTRKNSYRAQSLLVNDTNLLKKSFYNVSNPTKFITHGWTSDGSSNSCMMPKDGFLSHGDYNVIIVDWSAYSKKNYVSSASRVKAIGNYVSEMIKFLAKLGNDKKRMSLVGHSLGAHVMGLAGYKLSPKIGHIVGLDPARPGFERNGRSARLFNTDADHVEIIHTNAGSLGFSFAIGDYDYWPNGGARQPGCKRDVNGACSHGRSFHYYTESLFNPDDWYAVKCNRYMEFLTGGCLGNVVRPFPRWEPVVDKPRGNYMLRTEKNRLFGLGILGAEPPRSKSPLSTR